MGRVCWILFNGIFMIDIKIFKAENGDAFLIKFDNGQNILVDMGMPKTYENEIKQELINLNKQGQKIDLLIITHIDEDHIGGAIKFLEENQKSEIIEVSEIWHNSYRQLQFEKSKVSKVNKDTIAVLESIIKQNQSTTLTDGIQKVSAKQGSSLASLIYKYGYDWNTTFSNSAIYLENKSETVIGNLKFIFLSPNQDKLKKLSKKWIKELKSNKYDFEISDEEIFDDAFEFYIKFLKEDNAEIVNTSASKSIDFEKLSQIEEKDNSPTNGSSIAFIIEYKNKKLLFLGDSHEDIIFENLKSLKAKDYSLKFDLMKVSHHGSNKNISKRLIDLIDCDKFLFSTDGLSHGHPDLEALSKIVVKKTEYQKELLFNYNLYVLEELNNEDLKKQNNYEVKFESEIKVL